MAYRIAVLRGTSAGADLARAAIRCLDALDVPFDWNEVEVDEVSTEAALPEDLIRTVRDASVALKIPRMLSADVLGREVDLRLCRALDLYAAVRPCRTLPGVKSRYRDIDLVVVRENTEDLYAGIELEKGSPETFELIRMIEKLGGGHIRYDSGVSVKPLSVGGCRRILTFAFEYARRHRRRKVTAVHKANVMKHSDGLFLGIAREIALDYPDIAFDDRIVDRLCMQLVQHPERFDVLVMPNLYGDIVSELCAGLVGGSTVAPGANLGDDVALFETDDVCEAADGCPTALVLTGALMLRHLGEDTAADRLESAVSSVLAEESTGSFDPAEAILARIRN